MKQLKSPITNDRQTVVPSALMSLTSNCGNSEENTFTIKMSDANQKEKILHKKLDRQANEIKGLKQEVIELQAKLNVATHECESIRSVVKSSFLPLFTKLVIQDQTCNSALTMKRKNTNEENVETSPEPPIQKKHHELISAYTLAKKIV